MTRTAPLEALNQSRSSRESSGRTEPWLVGPAPFFSSPFTLAWKPVVDTDSAIFFGLVLAGPAAPALDENRSASPAKQDKSIRRMSVSPYKGRYWAYQGNAVARAT